tara:strand:- start:272 stop:1867 length:1596 start_codon:yes stop_codon:yes gene_type:complete
MAVVSISRIQVRRGRKTELPQLASGEFGWSVDSQELYLGNGAVAEGAPYVGNTKLLSEHDNLFAFADTYSYKSTEGYVQSGPSVNSPILRTLQDRLDDIVSIKAFGGTGDGSDHTAILQRALDQLYLNAANKSTVASRVILQLEPGTYAISSTLKVPPYATIRGAGIDKTIINAGGNVALETVNESSIPGSYNVDTISNSNQARNIELSGLTIQTTDKDALYLVSCKDSIFKNLKLDSTWSIGNTLRTSAGCKLTSHSSQVGSNNNTFTNVSINGFSDCVYSDYDVQYNIWSNCSFGLSDVGLNLGSNSTTAEGQAYGPSNNIIEGSIFDNIARQGINIVKGGYNSSNNNKFYNVGNHGGAYTNTKTPNIIFATAINYSSGDYFRRTESLMLLDNTNAVAYVPEISGIVSAKLGYTYQIAASQQGAPATIISLAADTSKTYIIDYVYNSADVNAKRTGKLEIFFDPATQDVQVTDEYQYTGTVTYEEALVFNATLADNDADATYDTLRINYSNSAPDTISTKLTYTISTKT